MPHSQPQIHVLGLMGGLGMRLAAKGLVSFPASNACTRVGEWTGNETGNKGIGLIPSLKCMY